MNFQAPLPENSGLPQHMRDVQISKKSRRPSRVSIPPRAHPHARLVFALMREHNVTHDELQFRSGILRSTLKSYRKEKTPSLQSIEALLGSFGYALVPVPPLECLPPKVREQLEEVGMHFRSDEETMAAVVAILARQWAQQSAEGPSPRPQYKTPYWLGAESDVAEAAA